MYLSENANSYLSLGNSGHLIRTKKKNSGHLMIMSDEDSFNILLLY